MEKKKGQHHAHAHADSYFLVDKARGVSAGERREKEEKGRRHGNGENPTVCTIAALSLSLYVQETSR